MRRIRRRVDGLPDAKHIMNEIERARLKADGIVTGRSEVPQQEADRVVPPPTRWKLGVKSRVADLIRRVVWMNFRVQKAFNNSVIGVLQLMAEDLYAHERRLNVGKRSGEHERGPDGTFDRAAYEEAHLDARPFIRRSLLLFRKLLRDGDVALELFCGRGELLASFAEHGITAVGVDPEASMVDLCLRRELRAMHADIFEHLRDSVDASYGAILAWRTVERLTNDQTVELLALAKRKLRRGGIFVASATNIDHPAALSKFYLDPSLIRPVPARLLGFLFEQSGLRIHHFTFSGGGYGAEELSEPALSREVYAYDEYTIVAVND
jgi:SAM-dependent methyltransferase